MAKRKVKSAKPIEAAELPDDDRTEEELNRGHC